MERRKFLGLGIAGAAALALAPSTLSAIDFRATKPNAWTVVNPFEKGTKGKLKGGDNDHSGIKAALKEIFGTDTFADGKVKLKTPDIAENGAVVPVSVSSELAGSKVAILNNANPESLVAVFTVPAGQPIDYSVRIKMQQTGDIVAVVEADGKLYGATKSTKVTAGGCGG
jgi:sulfur-oxidizing protein SoxY